MDPVTFISVLAAIAGVVFGLIAFFRNRKQDNTDEGKRTGAIMSELGYIKSGVDDVKRKQPAMYLSRGKEAPLKRFSA